MEDTRMEEIEQTIKSEAHLTSAAAFVEGGIQDSCDDACSICLEAFCENEPSTLTTCKHEFHLQCILEWCQRSSQCPMCWQPISLKDPTSQELLEAVEQEKNYRSNRSRNATIFHHPTLGDFELQHLPVGATDAELEERILQHLAAAAAMGRARHVSRQGQRTRLPSQGRPHYLVFSTHPNGHASGGVPGSSAPAETDVSPSSPPLPVHEEDLGFSVSSPTVNLQGSPSRRSPGQDRGGPSSDFQAFSESLKSRVNAVSMRCKESITKSTRGWKERLFARNPSMAEISSEVRREVNAGIATVSRIMEKLEAKDSRGASSSSSENVPVSTSLDNNDSAPDSTSSGSTEA